MTPPPLTLTPQAPPTGPPRTVVSAVDAPQPRRCAHVTPTGVRCEETVDLWARPGGGLICRQHLLEHDVAAYGQDAVDRRRTEAK